MATSSPQLQQQPNPNPNPIPTLYISNLNTRIKKPELKRLLHALFSPHGQILSIVALKTGQMRGQAFVVFKDLSSAVVAMRALQGYPFFDKSLRIQFANSKSEATKEMEIIMTGGQIFYTREKNEEEEADDEEEE